MTAIKEEVDALRPILGSIKRPVIVELGACTGEDIPWIRESCGYDIFKYIAVEPDPENLKVLKPQAHLCGITVVEAAVSHMMGTTSFHVNHNHLRMCGSVRKPTLHISRFPHVHFGKIIEVKTVTLDWVFNKHALPRIDMLWVDTQGAERDVILGGEYALKHTRYIFMEADTEQFYEGAALRSELISMLEQRGFKLLHEFEQNILLEKVA